MSAGLTCPKCAHDVTGVTDSRPASRPVPSIRRRRRCEACDHRFKTIEVIVDTDFGGPENDRHLAEILRDVDQVFVGWGPLAKLPRRPRTRFWLLVAEADGIGEPLWFLGSAKDGHPRHPLMVGYDTEPRPWRPPL